MSAYVTKTVRLRPVTKAEAQDAVDAIEEIFDGCGLSELQRMEIWEHYQTLTSNVLLRFAEFDPDVGYLEQNVRT